LLFKALAYVDIQNHLLKKDIVIPAKAGIHHPRSNFKQVGLILIGPVMDSRLRGNDEAYVFKYFVL
jgi:hypothetical protein